MDARVARNTLVLASLLSIVTSIGCAERSVEDPGAGTSVGSTDLQISLPDSETASSTDGDAEYVDRLFLPDPWLSTNEDRPMIVLVPGGGWVTADPSGLVPLAEDLATRGAVVATVTHRAASDASYFPIPVRDVACGIAAAAAAAENEGFTPTEVVAAGHSSGAHLAALFALRPDEFTDDCGHPPVVPDRLLGLAGPYDVALARIPARDLFGPDNADPVAWSEGNPVEHASSRPDMDVLLIHGRADDVVPTVFTEQFAEALVAGGHVVDTHYPDDADHHSVYSAEIAAPLIADWLDLHAAPASNE